MEIIATTVTGCSSDSNAALKDISLMFHSRAEVPYDFYAVEVLLIMM